MSNKIYFVLWFFNRLQCQADNYKIPAQQQAVNVSSHITTTVEQTFKTEQILKTKEFSDFYKLANDFCDFIENYPKTNKVDFLKLSRQHLLNLYNSELVLPWVDLQSNIDYDEKILADVGVLSLSYGVIKL